jgi:DNA-binding transcriptional LysR family regulator
VTRVRFVISGNFCPSRPTEVPIPRPRTVSLPTMLEVGRLRALLAMSEHGGSSGAARALGRPAGDVAGQLSDWERELGLTLVDGDRLTPAGRRLAEHAGTLLSQLESAQSDAAAVAGRPAGTLRLGVGAAAGRVLLPDTLATLRSTDVRLRLRQLADERVGALDSTLDAVVVGEHAAAVPYRPDAAVERRELFTEPLLLAVPSRHRATGASVRLAELAGEAWILGAGDTLLALERAAAAAGFAPRVVAEVGEDALALTLVAAGVGVALVPASAAPSPAEGVRFLAVLDGGLRRTVLAAVRRTRIADPAVRLLLDALAGAARRVAAAVPGVAAAAGPPGPAAPSGPAAPAQSGPPAPGRRPDPLFDPLPPEPAPRENGRRDPWADRARPEGLNGANGTGTDLPPRNGTAFGSDHPARNGSLDPSRPGYGAPTGLPGPGSPSGAADLPGRNGSDPLGFSGPVDRPGGNGIDPLGPPPADRTGRNGTPGFGGPGDLFGPSGPADRAGRNRTPDLPGLTGPPDLPGRSGPADLPGRGGPADLPGRGGPADLPGRGGPADLLGGGGPADLPGRGGPADLPGRGGPADLLGGGGPADLPGRGGPADLPGRGGPADLPGRGGPADLPGRRGPADLAGRGGPADGLPPAPGTLPVPERPPGEVPAAGPARQKGAPAPGPEFDDLAGLSGLSGFSGRPSRPEASGGDRGPGLPGRIAGSPGFGDGGALPPPGAVPGRETGRDTPARGSSPYRTPPPSGDAPEFAPDLPSRSGPNPYRPDTSGHPAPDPFRSSGAEPGPNPYRGGQPRRDSLGGSELFTATRRPGAELPPAPPDAGTRHRSRARGADGTLPPAPAGAADDVRLSIFEDLQSEWFTQHESGTRAESWQMAADDGWAAAARLAEPTTAGTTTAGLPRRRPQAMVVPGTVGGPAAPGGEVPPQPGMAHRSPQEVRGRLSSYRDGVRRGRHAQRPADEE